VTAAVKAATDKPVRLLVNTHWHFDHVGGNETLAKAGAVIVAHENVREQMNADRHVAVIDTDVPASPAVARPALTFTDTLTLHWGDEVIRLIHVPAAHTDGDCIVHFTKANVLHVGDIWFNGMFPFMDLNAGGSLDGIVAAFDLALSLVDEKTQIIPGHGPGADLADMREYRNMLATVRDRVHALRDQGKTRDEIVAAKPTAEFNAKWGRSWLDADTWVGLVWDTMERAAQSGSDLSGIEAFRTAHDRAAAALNADALVALWTQDGIMLPSGLPPIVGKEAIGRFLHDTYASAEGAAYIRNEHKYLDTKVVGQWAFESGVFDTAWKTGASEEPFTMRGSMLRVLRRQPDGTWKCARAAWNIRDQSGPTETD
jgi:glyoxylase-like metal-dependent hydrolase (beta-lactamase superfamily II)/ketosteroid isomerase-like protein